MKKNTKLFYSLLLTLLCTTSHIHAVDKTEKPLIKFGIIADIQYCDCETRGSRHYRNSLIKLDECVTNLNKEEVEFTINLGDLVDRDTHTNLDSVLIRLNNLNSKVHNTTGNHDYGGITDNAVLYSALNMPAEYYSFSRNNWTFILLNTNEVASYANVERTEKEAELQEMLGIIKEAERSNGASYNGGISKKQMEWLTQELDKAQQKSQNVIIFTHHPLYGVKGLTALNDLEIVETLSKYSCVKCVISGHHHAGAFRVDKNIPFITTEGMIETADENAYGIVSIYTDKLEFAGKGRAKSHTITYHI